jgi:hypothetical protein
MDCYIILMRWGGVYGIAYKTSIFLFFFGFFRLQSKVHVWSLKPIQAQKS